MRDFFFDLVDTLELVFLDPLRYSEEIEEIPFAKKPLSHWLFSVLAALSLSVGLGIFSVPYSISTLVFLVFGFFAHLILFRYFPFFFVLVVEFYAQKKGRASKLRVLLSFARHAVILYILFTPIAVVLRAVGFSGTGIGLFLLVVFTLLYTLIFSQGLQSIYELKQRDSLRFSFLSLLLVGSFPFLMNLYTATTILQSLAGGLP